MSEEITVKEEPEVALNTKDVEIDVVVNGENYKGIVTISLDDCHDINLHSLLSDYDEYAYHNGFCLCKICHILAGEALYQAGEGFDDDIVTCCETGYHIDVEFTQEVCDSRYCIKPLAYYFEDWDTWYPLSETEEHDVRDEDGYTQYRRGPASWFEDMYYCDHCNCYVDGDDWDDDNDMCRWCYEESHKIIEGYSESHEHDPILFGDYESEDSFVGLGFELEVDGAESLRSKNNRVAEGLCEASELDDDEMRFAYDGSLNNGFEIISQPHTVKAFWERQANWAKMLRYLSDNGYKSHDPGTCGLHVHVSRGMFGSKKSDQDTAIAKVYTFFDDNWDDIVKVSRRRSFRYCCKNELYSEEYAQVSKGEKTKFDFWKKKSVYEGGHGVALNNSNRATFEYRLGRGTLNSWSFFSWIDFVLTITKNAKRITIGKVETNDRLSWLGGITESTAKYIYKRGAFQKEMLALYPNLEWENDLIESE